MKCKQCRKEIVKDSKYCRYCGYKILIEDSTALGVFGTLTATFRKSIDFRGRASRREYWLFVFAIYTTSFILGSLEELLDLYPEVEGSVFSSVFSLIIIVPWLSVGIRRMHDVGKSGINLVIPFYNLILALQKGHEGKNAYGPEPSY